MQLNLEPQEARVLHDVLTEYLSNLRFDIRDTESYEMRQDLKEGERIIKDIIADLERMLGEQRRTVA